MSKREILMQRATSLALQYGLAVVSILIGVGLALLGEVYGLHKLEFPLLLSAIAVTIWYAGNGPGVLALLTAVLGFEYFFAEPRHSFALHAEDRPLFAVFILFALIIAWFSARRRRMERDLREARDKLQIEMAERTQQANLLDLTHDTIFVRDMSNVITYWNRGALESYGWTAGDAIGMHSHDLLQTVFSAPLKEINGELLRTGRWEGELVHTKRDGTQVVVASRWSLQRDEQGTPLAILETNNDITEHRRAEEALRKSQADLAHVSRVTTLGEMAASIAHEVNQPLSAVVTNANACLRWLALQSPDLDEARAAVERIIRDGSRASTVVGRIRALVQKSPPHKERLNINDIILEVIALARSQVQGNRVSLQTQLSDAVPFILGDRIQLQQLILNLINNAIEAISGVSEGPRELLVGSRKDESKGVLVAVRDSGPGLNPENQDRLFTPFYTTKPQGMGMGLAICRSIIEAHGGRLWATANQDKGATFRFILPTNGEQTP
jgi:two-component system sensor kinase FixL